MRDVSYKAKEGRSVKCRRAAVHGEGVTWHPCGRDGCDYKTKWKGDLKRHRAAVHEEGVIWHECGHEGCDYKSE